MRLIAFCIRCAEIHNTISLHSSTFLLCSFCFSPVRSYPPRPSACLSCIHRWYWAGVLSRRRWWRPPRGIVLGCWSVYCGHSPPSSACTLRMRATLPSPVQPSNTFLYFIVPGIYVIYILYYLVVHVYYYIINQGISKKQLLP